VERNLLRRRLREIGRTEVLPRLRQQGCAADVLVRARPSAYEADFPDLRAELNRLTEEPCSDAF
jgi:ribonuclease P protein component